MAARLPDVERDEAPPEVQTVYDRLKAATGRVLNIDKLMAHHSQSLPAFLEWYPKTRQGALDPKLRQPAYVRASELNRCQY